MKLNVLNIGVVAHDGEFAAELSCVRALVGRLATCLVPQGWYLRMICPASRDELEGCQVVVALVGEQHHDLVEQLAHEEYAESDDGTRGVLRPFTCRFGGGADGPCAQAHPHALPARHVDDMLLDLLFVMETLLPPARLSVHDMTAWLYGAPLMDVHATCWFARDASLAAAHAELALCEMQQALAELDDAAVTPGEAERLEQERALREAAVKNREATLLGLARRTSALGMTPEARACREQVLASLAAGHTEDAERELTTYEQAVAARALAVPSAAEPTSADELVLLAGAVDLLEDQLGDGAQDLEAYPSLIAAQCDLAHEQARAGQLHEALATYAMALERASELEDALGRHDARRAEDAPSPVRSALPPLAHAALGLARDGAEPDDLPFARMLCMDALERLGAGATSQWDVLTDEERALVEEAREHCQRFLASPAR